MKKIELIHKSFDLALLFNSQAQNFHSTHNKAILNSNKSSSNRITILVILYLVSLFFWVIMRVYFGYKFTVSQKIACALKF